MNPYEPPSAEGYGYPPWAAPGKITALDYMRPFQWVFESQNWFVNVLLVMVCMFIPIVGPLVAIGYQFTIIEYLHRRQGPAYPDFDFGRFGDLLVRGLWPFLVSLVANLILVPLLWIVAFAMIMCVGFVGAAMAEGGGEGVAAICGILGMLLMFGGIVLLSVLLAVVLVPMMLRAGLAQEFGAGFDFGFVRDFIGKMWKEMVLAFLVYILAAWLAMALGALVLCVGMYFAAAYMMLVYSHLLWQLYEVYLSRGGKPIPLKEPLPAY